MIRCWLRGHIPLIVQVRDDTGRLRRPHTVVWICSRCHKQLGETILTDDHVPQGPVWPDSPGSSRRSS